MKSTIVQTISAVALQATTASTDDASIDGLSPLNWAIVYCPAVGSVYVHWVCACTIALYPG